MQLHEFDAQLLRLKNTYGDKAYGDERALILWRELRNFPASWFQSVVDELIGACRMAPMFQEFREHISRFRERDRSDQRGTVTLLSTASCSYCNGNGVYLCTRIDADGLWAFRCHCSKGQADPRRAIPFYTDEHRKEYRFHDVSMRANDSA